MEDLKLHGTTTLGMKCVDGIVMATDTRAVLGSYFIAHKKVKKLIKIDNHLAMTIAGGVADAQNVVDTIKYYARMYKVERGLPIPVRTAANLASLIFFSSRLYPYIADVIVGGYDNSGARIYNIDLFGNLTEERFVSTGSGSPVAYGILESEYREGIRTDEAIDVAVKALVSAIKRNAGTGDGFDVCIITGKGFRELGLDEKRAVMKRLRMGI